MGLAPAAEEAREPTEDPLPLALRPQSTGKRCPSNGLALPALLAACWLAAACVPGDSRPTGAAAPAAVAFGFAAPPPGNAEYVWLYAQLRFLAPYANVDKLRLTPLYISKLPNSIKIRRVLHLGPSR